MKSMPRPFVWFQRIFQILFSIVELLMSFFGYCPMVLYQTVLHPLELITFLHNVKGSAKGSSGYLSTLISNDKNSQNRDTVQFMQEIFAAEGVRGFYRGIEPKILEYILVYPATKILWFSFTGERYNEEADLTSELIFHTLQVILSQPLYTATVACFMGFAEEECPLPLIFKKIYKKAGCLGFYHGVLERIVSESIYLVVRAVGTRILHVHKYKADSMLDFGLMLLRDAVAKWMAMPFIVLANRATANAIR